MSDEKLGAKDDEKALTLKVQVHVTNEASTALASLREKLMQYGESDWERR